MPAPMRKAIARLKPGPGVRAIPSWATPVIKPKPPRVRNGRLQKRWLLRCSTRPPTMLPPASTLEQAQIRGLGPELLEGDQWRQARVIEPNQTENRGEAEHPLQGAAAVAPGIEQAGVLTATAADFPIPIRAEQ